MKNNFTPQQVKWASRHDWFISGNESEIICKDDYIQAGMIFKGAITHTDFIGLRNWAGY